MAIPTASAIPFTDLIVFGDSLSDVGNTDYWTTDSPIQALAPDTPGEAYFDGRFSNGPVFTEHLADGLGFGPLTESTFGGNNFAFGGAYTSRFFSFEEAYIDDFDTQVGNYLDEYTVDANALHTVLIGANNFLRGGQTNTTTPAGHVGDALDDLAAGGAQQFLVLNLPWLGLTPAHNGSLSESDEWNQRSRDYNDALAAELDAFELANPTAVVHRLDLAGLLNELVADASDRGFTNVTESAAPGLDPGVSGYDESLIVDDPDAYVFWDTVHPTAAVHRILGFEAIRAVLPVGDYNRDGDVGTADFSAWRNDFGSIDELAADANSDGRIDGIDYAIWRESLPSVPAFATPEPNTLATVYFLLLATATARAASRRPRFQAARDTRRTPPADLV